MKKILITGCNHNQNIRKYYLRQNLKVVPSHYSLFNCLHHMGYEVEQRKVEIGEDLSQYDKVIVFLASPTQMLVRNFFNGIWALSQRPDAIIAYDDWQVEGIYKDICAAEVDKKKLLRPFVLSQNEVSEDIVLKYRTEFERALKMVEDNTQKILISAFSTKFLNDSSYGPHLLFGKQQYDMSKIYTYNPNPFHRNRIPGDFHHEGREAPDFECEKYKEAHMTTFAKEKKFNFASLLQSSTVKWLQKQGFVEKTDETGLIGNWEVELYGARLSSQKRLTEDKMIQTIASQWGCLMPEYKHSGSGWWRARPLQTADCGAILFGGKKELTVYYGRDYPFFDMTAKDITDLNDEELLFLAETQCGLIYRHHPLDKDIQMREIKDTLEA